MHNNHCLSEATRRRGLIAILVDTFFMWGGFFMVIPLISVHYVDDLGWSAASIGLVLAVRQLTQQGLTLPGGMLADRVGAKWLICAGMLLRAAGFACMAWADTFPLLLASALLAAIGGSLFESPLSAAIAAIPACSTRKCCRPTKASISISSVRQSRERGEAPGHFRRRHVLQLP